ncbi:unnamed protein product [Lasius platythorax]|uniref:Uncharacterized protein n=1 Tax=Lasius platythorax TaxID=488582 RepID=A0AAV2N1B1_9HYME
MSVRQPWCLEEDGAEDEEILRLEKDRDKGNEGNIHGVLVNTCLRESLRARPEGKQTRTGNRERSIVGSKKGRER